MKSTTKSYQAGPGEVEREWLLVDAAHKPLGRVASEVAMLLRGKRKPTYTPHVDTGDFVVVINASRVALTGHKAQQKTYYRHSQWVGSLEEIPVGQMLERHPERVVIHAVRGMLPKNTLGRRLLTKLKVYPDAEHPHGAQRPRPIDL
jgi:large subunit ribosomal protein L13